MIAVGLVSLVAVLAGGVFASQAHAANITITKPVSGDYVRGVTPIEWNFPNLVFSTTANVTYSNNFQNWQDNAIGSTVSTTTLSHNWDTNEITDGTYKIRVEDNLGNNGTSDSFTIDNTPPTTTLATTTNPATTGWYNSITGTPTITLTCTDNLSGCSSIHYAWDGVATTTYSSAITAPEGDHVLSYYSEDEAVDNAGVHNIETAQTAEFKVDTVAPTISSYTLDGNTADAYFNPNNTNPNLASTTIALTASEPVTWVSAKIINTSNSGIYKTKYSIAVNGTDTGTFTWNGSLTAGTAPVDGVYKMTAHITDLAGNDVIVDLSTLTPHPIITVDTSAPTISLTLPTADTVYKSASAGGDTTNDTSAISFTSIDTNSLTYTYSVDGVTTAASAFANNDGTTATTAAISGLTDGRHTIIVTVTDSAGNSVDSGSISIVFDNNSTLTVSNTATDNADFQTIGDAVTGSDTAGLSGETINVYPGTYTENVTLNSNFILEGANVGIDPNGTAIRNTESIISPTSGTAITIAHNNVAIDGFTITNGGSGTGTGIYSSDHSGLTIQNNIITNIGNSNGDVVGRGIEVVSVSALVDSVSISNNLIENITSGESTTGTVSGGTSASAISIGWSAGSNDITDLLIQDNVISDIKADTTPWTSNGSGGWLSINRGYGAYGILINHKTTEAQITGNTISNLEGLWAHAIGLEGDTPNASVTDNTISNLIDHKSPTDAVGVTVQDNLSAGSVKINNNTFDNATVPAFVQNQVSNTTVDATKNYYGTAVYDTINDKMQQNTGTSALITFQPYYVNAVMTTLSTNPITDVYIDDDYVDGSAGSHIFGYDAFSIIQNGIDTPVFLSGTVHVFPGTYNEKIAINKDNLIVQSTGGAASTIINLPDSDAPGGVDITGNGVTFDGFTVRDFSDTTNESKIIRIGRNTDNTLGNNNTIQNNIIQGNIYQSPTNPTDYGVLVYGSDNQIDNNEIYDIGSYGIGGVYATADGNTISNNNIHNIGYYFIMFDRTVNTKITGNTLTNWVGSSLYALNPKSYGYGVVIFGASSGVTIDNQEVTGLPNGIVLSSASGVTVENSKIHGNTFRGVRLSGTSLENQIIGNEIYNNDKGVLLTSTVGSGNSMEFNSIHGNTSLGAENLTGNINAEKNWWGNATGPENATLNSSGQGDLASDNIDFSPFCQDVPVYNTGAWSCTLVSVDPIASFDLVFDPTSAQVNTNSILTVTAKDAGGYTVINDTTTPISLSVVSGVATLNDLTLTMGTNGTTTTTITSSVAGTAGVRAVDQNNTSAFGTGTITFTATAPIIPSLTIIGAPIASPYTVDQATTRFSSGLRFNTTNAVSATVNGVSTSITSNTITVASASDAATLGLHLYNIVVTSSTGNTATKIVGYQVNANSVTPVIPTIALYGDAIVPTYTLSEAQARFADGLQFTMTGASGVTVNGVTSVITGDATAATTTIAELDAAALGFHLYNVVVTSSTGDIAGIAVAYHVGADFDDSAELGVTSIVASSTMATADDTFENGWSWVFNIRVPTNETQFKMEFSDFVNGADSIAAAGNIRFYSAQSSDSYSTSTATMITAANDYSDAITLDTDLEPTTAGRQIKVIVEMKVPVGSAGGSYSASYGVSSN